MDWTKEKRSAYNKEYYLKYKIIISLRKKQNSEEYKKRRKINSDRYYTKHKKERLEYFKEHKERKAQYDHQYHLKHREEKMEYRKENYPKRKHKYTSSKLVKQYGITLEQYYKILEKQNYKCAICGRSVTELKKNLAIDHDHITGKLRELLCQFCNTSLGNVKDDIEILRRMIEYLIKHKNENSI